MLRRFQTGWADGFYSLIAGHVDGGETFKEAMIREAQEEAGIVLKVEDLRLVHTMHRNSDSERLSLFFKASMWQGEPRNMEPHKCDDMDWFHINARPDNTVAYVDFALDRIADNQPYSEFGWSQ